MPIKHPIRYAVNHAPKTLELFDELAQPSEQEHFAIAESPNLDRGREKGIQSFEHRLREVPRCHIGIAGGCKAMTALNAL